MVGNQQLRAIDRFTGAVLQSQAISLRNELSTEFGFFQVMVMYKQRNKILTFTFIMTIDSMEKIVSLCKRRGFVFPGRIFMVDLRVLGI